MNNVTSASNINEAINQGHEKTFLKYKYLK